MGKYNNGNNNGGRNNHIPNPSDMKISDMDKLTPEEIEEALTKNLDDPDIDGSVSELPNALLYNTSALSPISVTYRILISTLKKCFKDILSHEINDIYDVRVKYKASTGEVYWYVIFNEGSRHFIDRSLDDTLLSNQKQKYYSPEVRKFAARFGIVPKFDCIRSADGKIIGDMARFKDANNLKMNELFVPTMDGNGNRVNAYSMRLSWTTLVSIMFDFNGAGFKKKYGSYPPKTNNKMFYKYSPRGGNPFGALDWLEVTKEYKSLGHGRDLTPRESFDMTEG